MTLFDSPNQEVAAFISSATQYSPQSWATTNIVSLDEPPRTLASKNPPTVNNCRFALARLVLLLTVALAGLGSAPAQSLDEQPVLALDSQATPPVLPIDPAGSNAGPISGTEPVAEQNWQAKTTPDTASPADATRNKLGDVRKANESNRQQANALDQNLRRLAREQEELKTKLIETAAKVQEAEATQTRIDGRIAELSVQSTGLRTSLKSQHGVLTKLLGALQRMGRDPPPVMITQRDDALKMVRSALQLSAVFPELRDRALDLAGKLSQLDKNLAESKSQSEQLAASRKQFGEDTVRLAGLQTANAADRDKATIDLGDMRQRIETGMRDEADLTGALNLVVAKVEQMPALRSTLGKYDQELKEAPPAAAETDEPAPPVVETAAIVSRIKPAKPFERTKGQLRLPVQGRRLLNFGDVTKTGIRLKGQAYATRPGAQVISPCDGWIVYAGEFRSYGQLLIINTGGGYHVLLAGLNQVDVTMGQFVLARQPVGKMGAKRPTASSSSGDQTTDSSPLFYVEFRHKEQPINPAPWWSDELAKVQG